MYVMLYVTQQGLLARLAIGLILVSDPAKISLRCFDFGSSYDCVHDCKITLADDYKDIKLQSPTNYTEVALKEKQTNVDWAEVTSTDSLHEPVKYT